LKVEVDQNSHRIDKKIARTGGGTSWKDIDKFEKQNTTISVNVYGYEYGIGVYPLRISNYIKPLLLISEGETQHYCWIKSISRIWASN